MSQLEWIKSPLTDEQELINRCQTLAGLTFAQLAKLVNLQIPHESVQRKGWTGLAIEKALGAEAGSQALPDFIHLGIELKTLPINQHQESAESTFITSIPLLTIHQQTWKDSQCYAKLKKVLWMPVEGDRSVPFAERRIGQGFLWSPTAMEETVLAEDWTELTFLISSGQLNKLNARIGRYLQVRPKAANSKSLCYGYNEEGQRVLTLPRGFYLRRLFTTQLLQTFL